MKKIAVPTRGTSLDDHFGHCESYTIFTIDDTNKVNAKDVIPSTQDCGCKSNIATKLNELGVSVMLAGNIGPGAVNVLGNVGIKVFRGYSGNIDDVLKDYLNGVVGETGANCNHDHGHTCSH